MTINPNIYSFFSELNQNNNREWFNRHKDEFKLLEKEINQFGSGLFKLINEHDSLEKFKLFRIYRDVRFSKDKTPYKTHFGMAFKRTKPMLRGGYYLHLAPKNNFLACGFWGPEPADLNRIRKEFEIDANEFRSITKNNEFYNIWGELEGEELKTAPKGFDKNHPNIDLIRKKQYIFTHHFDAKESTEIDFDQRLSIAIKKARPFVDYMTGVLTTDLNGESLL